MSDIFDFEVQREMLDAELYQGKSVETRIEELASGVICHAEAYSRGGLMMAYMDNLVTYYFAEDPPQDVSYCTIRVRLWPGLQSHPTVARRVAKAQIRAQLASAGIIKDQPVPVHRLKIERRPEIDDAIRLSATLRAGDKLLNARRVISRSDRIETILPDIEATHEKALRLDILRALGRELGVIE